MSMTLTIYSNFSKRRNSTKQPSSGTDYSVNIKDGCSVENPVFLIDGINLNANYCSWDGHYYFIEDIILSNSNIYELHCSMDVLATFKSQIGSSTQFIERAASAYDTLVQDNLLSQGQSLSEVHQNFTTISKISTAGCYTIQTFSIQGVRTYVYSDMSTITGILNNDAYGINSGGLQALINTIGMNILDVSAYVSNVMWHPFSKSAIQGAGTSENIAVAFFPLNGITGDRVLNTYITDGGNITMPGNEYASTDFRRYDPAFSRYSLYLPGVGTVALPAINASMTLYYVMTYDIYTGGVTYNIYNNGANSTQALLATYSGQLGISVPWSTQRIDAPSLIEHIVAPNINIGGGYAGMAQSTVHAGMAVVRDTIEPQYSIHSGSGNLGNIKVNNQIKCAVQNFISKEFPLAECGRPLKEHRTISTLSGYIKCGNASLDIPGMGAEKEKVNSYLNNGFYYE